MIYVHRWLYENYIGKIPKGHVLHHSCDTPHCVNPAHLVPITQRSNIRQFTSIRNHCKQGHPLTGSNLYVTPQGTRMCRACRRNQQRLLGTVAHQDSDRDAHKHIKLPKGTPVFERIMARVVKRKGPLESLCWIWMGALCGPGYGQIRITEDGRSRRLLVHRWMYERHNGPIPDRTEVHHLCDTPRCINPKHLAAVTHAENILATTSKITHCKHGHELSGDNVLVYDNGRRVCRRCRYRRTRESTAQRDAQRRSSLHGNGR
jgi:hypothetical protein